MLTRFRTEHIPTRAIIALELLSPGIEFREGVNFILEAGTGWILVVGDDPHFIEGD